MSKKIKTLKELKDEMIALRQQIELRERDEAEKTGRALLDEAGCTTLAELRQRYKLLKIAEVDEHDGKK